jgi:hypothetical protein
MRVSLSPLAPGDLPIESVSPPLSRSEYLRQAFSKDRTFFHRGRPFVFKPMALKDDRYVAGHFSRERPVQVHGGPDEDFPERLADNWELAFAILNFTAGDQRAAMEVNRNVGDAVGLMSSFMGTLPQVEGFHGYTVYVLPLFNEEEYWEVVEKNEGSLTEAEFVLIPPNAFEANKALANLVQAVNEQSKSERSQHRFMNKEGNLDAKNEQLAGLADTAINGAGEATLRSGRKVLFSSRSHRRKIAVAKNEIPTPADLFGLGHIIGRLFGRSDND